MPVEFYVGTVGVVDRVLEVGDLKSSLPKRWNGQFS